MTCLSLFDIINCEIPKSIKIRDKQSIKWKKCHITEIRKIFINEWMNLAKHPWKGKASCWVGHSSCVLYRWASPIELKFFRVLSTKLCLSHIWTTGRSQVFWANQSISPVVAPRCFCLLWDPTWWVCESICCCPSSRCGSSIFICYLRYTYYNFIMIKYFNQRRQKERGATTDEMGWPGQKTCGRPMVQKCEKQSVVERTRKKTLTL